MIKVSGSKYPLTPLSLPPNFDKFFDGVRTGRYSKETLLGLDQENLLAICLDLKSPFSFYARLRDVVTSIILLEE